MPSVKAWLLGKPDFFCETQSGYFKLPQRAEYLFCFLLSHRSKQYNREQLAEFLWQDCSADRSKPYFRKTLWQLQTALDQAGACRVNNILDIDAEWICVNMQIELWVDIYILEQSLQSTRGIEGPFLAYEQYQTLESGAALYRGDFLENCYQDWCLVERERYREIYLEIVDKLMSYCEAHCHFDTAISYGLKILNFDYARESTHYRLMRLKYLAGDRTGALRQYEFCRQALHDELHVKPAENTRRLLNNITRGLPLSEQSFHIPETWTNNISTSQAIELLEHLIELQTTQSALLVELQHKILLLEKTFTARK